METITVELGARSYPIHIGSGVLDGAGAAIRARLGEPACAIVTDDRVAPLYLARLERALEAAGLRHCALVLPHGEQTKCLEMLARCYAFLAENHITRDDALLTLGGGVMGDLGGLAAATWLRGIRCVQVPTTLLSQVDSSVGGKTAVDLPQGKNLVGAFHQPSLVLCDPDTLQTLSGHFWRDGLGEVVKYGCIGDKALFALLEAAAPGGRPALMDRMPEILRRCIQHKADVVARDELDTSLRMTLNFGHTLGHAVETCQHYQGLSHGMAVAAGMAEITRLSQARGLTQPGTAERLCALLRALELPDTLPADVPMAAVTAATRADKKATAAGLRLVVLRRIGSCFITEEKLF